MLYPGPSILCTSLSLFKLIMTKISIDSWLSSHNNPLWFNPNLLEFYSLPDPQRWSIKGVKYLCHFFTAQGFKSFYQLLVDFNLPGAYLFYYYQLRHAVRTQFGSLDNPIQVPPLKKLLRCSDPTIIISTHYSALVTDSNPRFRTAQGKWTSLDIPFREADWTEFSDT